MPFEEREIVIKGNRVCYFDEGLKEGVPVILIHGFPFSKEMWNRQLDALIGTHRVIAYDVRGHGHSEPGTVNFTIDQFVDDLFFLMDALSIDKAAICGHSMGGYIALRALEVNRERITILVLCNTQCNADTAETRDKRIKTIASIRFSGLKRYADELLDKLFAPKSQSTKPDEVAFIKNSILNTTPDTVCKTLQALAARKEACEELAKTKIPVMIMVGKEDKITPPERAKELHELIPGATFEIIDEAGHMSNLENTLQFNALLSKFLRQL